MIPRLIKGTLALAVAAIVAYLSFSTTEAHHAVLRFNLEEMEATADRIFLGRCVNVEETEEVIAQGMMPVTHYTFEVEQAIKGKFKKQLTFSQLGHRARPSLGKEGGIRMHGEPVSTKEFIHGMAAYEVGDRALLFLIPNYLGDKVTYPVGLDQGAFYISTMPSGNDLIRNGINNTGLFDAPYNNYKMRESDARIIFPNLDEPINLERSGGKINTQNLNADELTSKRGALPLKDFVSLVEQIVVAHGNQKGVIE
jgi:hypothetical protein